MIDLFYVEKAVANTATVFINRPCAVKKLRITYVNAGSGNDAVVVFRDGGANGTVRGRLSVAQDGNASDALNCLENEVLNFATNVFVEVSGNVMVCAYTMGNPVGRQGS